MSTQTKKEEKKYTAVIRIEYTKYYDVEVPLFATSEKEALQMGYEIVKDDPDRYMSEAIETGLDQITHIEPDYVEEG